LGQGVAFDARIMSSLYMENMIMLNHTHAHLRRSNLSTALSALLIAIPMAMATITAHAAAEADAARAPLLIAMHDMGMGGGAMGGMPGMGADQPAGGMSNGQKGGMKGMRMMDDMGMKGGMRMMGEPPGMGMQMAMPSALPGFPGASHLYHVGATDFFLDHADKLAMSVEQKTSLNGIKQKALMDQSAVQRKVDEAEQALWLLTAADQPDVTAVEGKLREIEKMKVDQRLAFIRSVGEAGKVLSADQRKMVLGMVPMPSAGHVPAPPK